MIDLLRRSKLFILAILLAVIVFWLLLNREANTTVVDNSDVPPNIEALLTDYSAVLNTGVSTHPSTFSEEMLSLIAERRSFYAGYYKTGLNLELEELETRFITDQMMVSDNGGVIHVDVREIVIMHGHPLIKKADEYPTVVAVDWAIAATDDKNVREALEQYQSSIIDGVNDSLLNGVEIILHVHHTMEIIKQNGKLRIVRDEFTDKEIDNGDGYDNIIWVNGKPQRQYPDFTTLLEYSTYHTPIKVLGQNLLDDFTRTYDISTNNNLEETPVPFTLPTFTPPEGWQEYSSEYSYTTEFSPDGSTGFLKYSLRYPAGWFLYPGSTISQPGLLGQTYIMNFERVGTDMWYQHQTTGTVKLSFYALPCRGAQGGCQTDLPEMAPDVYVFREVYISHMSPYSTVWHAAIYAHGFVFNFEGYIPGDPKVNTDLIETLDQILSTVNILDGGFFTPTQTSLPNP